MKTLVLTVWVSLLTSFISVRAQSPINYAFGVKGGMTMSRFLESKVKNNYWISYVTGLSVEQRFTERLSLSYDLAYSRQGNMMYISNPGLADRIRTKFDYLTLPVSVRYRLKNYPVLLIPGIQVSYLLDNKIDWLPNRSTTSKYGSSIRKVDFGPSIGLGYRFSRHFFGEVKYYQSFRTLIKSYSSIDPQTGTPIGIVPPERYNQVASASITYYPFVK